MKNNLMLVGRVNNPINTINVGKTIINNPPVITIFIGGIFTIPSHGWQKWHCFAHIIYIYKDSLAHHLFEAVQDRFCQKKE